MRTVSGLIIAALLIAGSASAETLFDNQAAFGSIKAYQGFLEQTRLKLYSSDDDEREDTLEMIEESLAKAKEEGAIVFPLTLLADFVTGVGAPADAEIDDDMQEDALDLILEVAENSKRSVSQRELAIEQLGRIIAADQLADMDWAGDALKALSAHAKGDDLVLMHAALVSLGRVAIKTVSEWAAHAEAAAEAIAERMGDENPEVRRIALAVAIKTLTQAEESTDAAEELWDELEDAIGDVESPSLQDEVRARVTALITKQQGGIFQDEVAAVRDELKKLKSTRKLASESLDESLEELRSEDDPVDIEAYLAKIERAVKDNPAARILAVSELATIAADAKIPAYKLRDLTDSLFAITIEARSAMAFHRTAGILAELVTAHKNTGRAAIPLAALARLMAATADPALIAPVVHEARALALSNLPYWIRRRLVALVFLQAGDALDEAVRNYAFQQLAFVGSTSTSWAVRYEVLGRMRQLATLAKQPGIRESAAQWN